jgi:hypothetical protein
MNWIKEDFVPKSDSLIIALSSFFGLKNDPNKWEWERGTGLLEEEMSFKRMFVKDLDEGWWQTKFQGLDDHGPHAIAKYLTDRIKASGSKRTAMMGISLGAYGALLLGCLCKVDLVISISPQTLLTSARYKKNSLAEKYAPYNINKEETDLKVVLNRYNNNFTKYKVYYGRYNGTDTKMAENIKDCNGVELFPLESSKHTVVDLMKSSGLIKELLTNFIQKGER